MYDWTNGYVTKLTHQTDHHAGMDWICLHFCLWTVSWLSCPWTTWCNGIYCCWWLQNLAHTNRGTSAIPRIKPVLRKAFLMIKVVGWKRKKNWAGEHSGSALRGFLGKGLLSEGGQAECRHPRGKSWPKGSLVSWERAVWCLVCWFASTVTCSVHVSASPKALSVCK